MREERRKRERREAAMKDCDKRSAVRGLVGFNKEEEETNRKGLG